MNEEEVEEKKELKVTKETKKKVIKKKVIKKVAKEEVVKKEYPKVTFLGEGGKWDSKLGGMLYFFKKGIYTTKDEYRIAEMRKLGFNELKV